MNKLVVVLAATTVAGASAALYYRRELVEQRARSAAVVPPAPASVPESASVPATASAVPAPVATPPSAAPPGTAKQIEESRSTPVAESTPLEMPGDDRKSRTRKQASEFLERYDDPSRRGELRAQALERSREGVTEYAKKQDLGAEQFDRLVAVLADQELERRAAQARCLADPECDRPGAEYSELLARQKQTLIDMLGEHGFRDLQEVGAGQVDRRMAEAFARRLPQNIPWSPDQSAALAFVLKDGRTAAVREMAAQRQHFRGFGNQDGMSVLYADELPTLEARLASANTYAQKMHDHAATVLSGEQLRFFNQLQAELLSDLERFLRRRDAGQRDGN
jgi:hypothetical protein